MPPFSKRFSYSSNSFLLKIIQYHSAFSLHRDHFSQSTMFNAIFQLLMFYLIFLPHFWIRPDFSSFHNRKIVVIFTLKIIVLQLNDIRKIELGTVVKSNQLFVIVVLLWPFLRSLFNLAWRCLLLLVYQRSNSTAISFLMNIPGRITS